MTIDPEAARRLLATLASDGPRARSRADGSGEPRDLARIVELAFATVPAARVFADAGARRELAAFDRAASTGLDAWFAAPFAKEASLRSAIFGARDGSGRGFAALMRAYRAADEPTRRDARASMDPLLDDLYERTAVQEIIAAYRAPATSPSPAPASSPAPTSSGGLLVLPSAELIQGLAGGATLDPALLATLAASEVPAAPPASSSPASSSPASSSPAATGATAATLTAELRDLLRALAESVLGVAPSSFGAWRAACAAFHVADFRPALVPALSGTNTRALPFEHVAVPLARAGAIVDAGADAWSASTHLLGAGRELAGDAYGGALLATTATRAFVLRGLSDRPGDPIRAARAFALCCGFRFAASRLEATDADTLRGSYDQAIGASPAASLARWWSLEPRLAGAPGESDALYAHTAALAHAILRGVQLASTLRDTHDEDWFRNPRLTPDRLRDLALLATPATSSHLIGWLREHARL